MLKPKQKFPYLSEGNIDIDLWLAQLKERYPNLKEWDILQKAALMAQKTGKGLTTFYGQPCLEQGLEMAEIMLSLTQDKVSAASAILTSILQHLHVPLEHIAEEVHPDVEKLVAASKTLQSLKINLDKPRDAIQIDRIRKMLIAMVSDIRVVLIKLAERTTIMRGIRRINPTQRRLLARETMEIYAPLANRLGIGQIKWELEDIAFRYIKPETYKKIAKFLAERRSDREQRIHNAIARIKEGLHNIQIDAKLSGRAKHNL